MSNRFVKLFSLFLVTVFSMQCAMALPVYTESIDPEYVKSKNSQKKEFVMPVFVDEAAAQLPKDCKKPRYIPRQFVDIAFVNVNVDSVEKKAFTPVVFKDIPVKLGEEDKYFVKPVFSGRISVDNLIPVKVSPDALIKPVSKPVPAVVNGVKTNIPQEYPLVGTRVSFKIVEDVYKNGELFIKKGTDAYAIVGRSVPAMFGGASGEVQVDRFRTFDVDGNIVRLSGVIENEGFSTGYLTNLIGMALVPFTFGTSALLVFLVPGTSGAIKPELVYTLYYDSERN